MRFARLARSAILLPRAYADLAVARVHDPLALSSLRLVFDDADV